MQTYRIYFRNPGGPVAGRTDFVAADDAAAFEVANVLWHACSDVVAGYEVWQGDRQVTIQSRSEPLPTSLDEVSARHQDMVIAQEEVIRTSLWAIARSRRLLKQLDGLISASQPRQ